MKWRLFVLIVITGTCKALDIKEFLNNEPLTLKGAINDVVEYFQQDDPRGIPVLSIPEPLVLGKEVRGTSIQLQDPVISGHSGLKLEYVDIDAGNLQAQLRISIPKLEITSPYTWPGSWGSSEGDVNVTFTDLQIGVIITLGANPEGQLVVTEMTATVAKELFLPDFTGLSFAHGALVSAADTLFDTAVLPLLTNAISTKGKAALTERLKQRLGEKNFPVDMHPVDFMLASKLIEKKLQKFPDSDSLKLGEKTIELPLTATLKLENIEVFGLLTLHRTKDLRVQFIDNRIYALVEVGTKDIGVVIDWDLSTSVFSVGSGTLEFGVESLKVSGEVVQDADIRNPPGIRMLDIDIGTIALRSSEDRRLDYALEALMNIMPNILKDILFNGRGEEVLKRVIQKRFDQINLLGRIDKIEDRVLIQ